MGPSHYRLGTRATTQRCADCFVQLPQSSRFLLVDKVKVSGGRIVSVFAGPEHVLPTEYRCSADTFLVSIL